jgi:tetratricopeptide (TPR) repeat protein
MIRSKFTMLLQAERMLQVALRADPAHAPTLKAYSRLLDESFRDLKGALEVSRRAFDADPADSGVAWRLGRLLMDEAKDYEGAEIMLRRALDLDLDCAEALYDYGRLLEEIHQNHDSAERMFRRHVPFGSLRPNQLTQSIFISSICVPVSIIHHVTMLIRIFTGLFAWILSMSRP